MAPPRKTLAQYELEARRVGPCFIHPSHGAARKVYIMRHGPLPSNIAVCHTCDTPKCIRDDHHFDGTWGDNIRDAVRKGRHSCFRKGGVRFSGPHTAEDRKKIGEAAKKMWAEGRGSRHFADKTACPRGHAYSPENTYVWNGHRSCRACRRKNVS